MSDVAIFWDPNGFELDSLGAKSFERITDGDTPYISMSIRMLSIDTPEVHYPGNSNPEKHDDKLSQLADWIQQGKAPVAADAGLAEETVRHGGVQIEGHPGQVLVQGQHHGRGTGGMAETMGRHKHGDAQWGGHA